MTPDVRVLVAEDEVLVRMLLEEELSEAGFEVVPAADGRQAEAKLEAEATRLRAIVTDIRLGRGPSGWDIARRAREQEPSVAVVYVSGDSVHEWAAKGVPNSVMVSKPFVPAQVITALATLLNQVGGP